MQSRRTRRIKPTNTKSKTKRSVGDNVKSGKRFWIFKFREDCPAICMTPFKLKLQLSDLEPMIHNTATDSLGIAASFEERLLAHAGVQHMLESATNFRSTLYHVLDTPIVEIDEEKADSNLGLAEFLLLPISLL